MKLISAKTVEKHTQTAGVRNEIDQILAPVLFTQGIYGLHVLDPNWSFRNNFLNFSCVTLVTIYVTVGTVSFMKNTDDVLLFLEGSFTVILNIQFDLKFIYFLCYRSLFRELYARTKTTLFDIMKEMPERKLEFIDLLRKMVQFLFVLFFTPPLCYFLIAMWFYINGPRVTLSRTTSILMPMTSPYYEIGLIIHIYNIFMVSFIVLVTDFWFVFLTYFLCEAFECATSILKVKRLEGEDDVSYENRLNAALGKFYSKHVKLVDYLNMLNDMYKWPLLVPLLSVLTCTCVFLLVVTEELNLQIATVMFPVTCQCLAYNMLGEKLKSKATEMNMAILNFDWTSMKLEHKKNYYIITCYMNNEIGIRTAVGIELSLLTLSSIYKGSYQVFAVLNTMKK